jgi:hypothetical protein
MQGIKLKIYLPAMKRFFLILVVLFCYSSYAQNNNSFIVKAGTSINESVPAADLYEYPEFKKGRVYFYSEPTSEAKINYHRLIKEMQFIALNGDTLTIDNEETIRLITVDKDSFYFDKGFIKLISSNNAGKLGVRQSLEIDAIEKMTGYNTTSSISSVKSINALANGGRMVKLLVKEDVLLLNESHYYFGDQFNHFLPANKKTLLKVFSKHEAKIKSYLKENKVVYSNRDDLEKLFDFIGQE